MAETRARDLAKSLGQAVRTDNIASDGSLTGGIEVYDSSGLLPTSYDSANSGQQAFAKDSDRLYIHTGQGWFNIAIVNTTPIFTTSPSASYDLATDATAYKNGTATTVTIQARDSEGFPVTYAATGNAAFNNMAHVDKDSAAGFIFTIEPKSQDSAGSPAMPEGTLTFTATDGINIASAASAFTLIFDTTVANSSNTVILPKVLANNGNERGNITDKSASPLTITETGDVSEGTFNPYYGNYSTSFTHRKSSSALATNTNTGFNDTGFNGATTGMAQSSIGVRLTSAIQFGSNNWCWELWVHRIKHYDETYGHQICGFSGGGAHSISFKGDEDRRLTMTMGGINSGNALTVSKVSLPLYEWVHLAAVRNGNAFTFYMNGVITYNSTSTFSSANPTDVSVGGGSAIVGYAGTAQYGNNNSNKFDYYYGGEDHGVNFTTQKYYFAGYIGDQRIVVGSPVYTGAFTPPTGSLTTTGGTYPSSTNVDTSITAGHTKLLLAGGSFRDLSSQTSPNGVSLAGNYKYVGYASGHFRKVPFGPYKNSAWASSAQSGSAYFDGTGDKLTFTGIQLAGQSHWTVECWAYGFPGGTTLDHATSPMVLIEGVANSSTATNNFILGYNKDNGTGFSNSITTGYRTQYSSRNALFQTENHTVVADMWQHIAVVNNNGDYAMYINGKKCTSTDSNPTSPAAQGCTDTSGTWVIGGTNDTSNGFYMFKGYLSDVRFVVGTAVYTGNFYPPTGPLTQTGGTYDNGSGNVNTSITAGHTKLLLNFTDSKLIDQGSNINYKSSGSVGSTGLQKYSVPSLEFNTVGDHVTTQRNTSFQKWSPEDNFLGYAPAPFTVECWVYLNSFDTSNLPFIWSAHDAASAPEISFDSSRNPTWKWGNTNRITSSIAVALTTWTHIAVTRAHGTTKMFVDGVLGGSVADTTNYTPHDGGNHPDIWYLGAQRENTAKRLNGYVSQFKITQGRSLYPFFTKFEAFTTTTAFQEGRSVGNAGADTKLIMFTTSSATTDASGTGKSISENTSGYNTAGLFGFPTGYSLNSTIGTHMDVASHADFGFGTGDFTLEFFAIAGTVTQMTPFDMAGSSTGWAPRIRFDNNGVIQYIANGSSARITSSNNCYKAINTVKANYNYVHIAISRVSGVTRMFVDGRQEGSDFADTNTYVAGAIKIGCIADAYSEIYYGQITNLRIVKGTGLYTGNFTPPSAEITG